MKRLTLIALLSALPHIAAAQNSWQMTCTDTTARTSAATELAAKEDGCRTTVTGITPTRRVDGSALAFSAIDYCTVTRIRAGVVEATRLEPTMPKLKHVYVDRPACCADATPPPTTPPVTPPVNPPTTFGPPVNFSVTITSGTTGRINCTAAPGTAKIILFAVNAGDKLGSRLKVYSKCGGTYDGFGKGRVVVLKAEDRQGKQSGRSNTFTIP